MTPEGPTILLSAGEPSGDAHGAAVARALRRRWPGARLYGLGGPRMAAEGVELLADLDRLAVMGFVEVAGRIPYFLALFRRLRRELVARGTHLVIPIDYPGFNLRLARAAHREGVPVLYYIAPQVWAWHVGRVRQLARYTDRLAVILPFEETWFRSAGASALYVGHPILDREPVAVPREEFAARFGLDPERPVLALFPGSRAQEIRRHLAVFEEAAALVRQARPEVQPVVAAVPTLPAALYAASSLPRTTDDRALLAHAEAAIVKSGTSTLEAAVAGVPMVVAYRTHPVTLWLARRLVQVGHIGLVNLIAGERIMPELIQEEATPRALADALLPMLPGGAGREAALAGLDRVRESLARGRHAPSAERVAELAAELIGGRG